MEQNRHGNYVKVKSIKRIDNQNVYCLGTNQNGNMVANGVVVSNCDAFRYALHTRFAKGKLEKREVVPNPRDNLQTPWGWRSI